MLQYSVLLSYTLTWRAGDVLPWSAILIVLGGPSGHGTAHLLYMAVALLYYALNQIRSVCFRQLVKQPQQPVGVINVDKHFHPLYATALLVLSLFQITLLAFVQSPTWVCALALGLIIMASVSNLALLCIVANEWEADLLSAWLSTSVSWVPHTANVWRQARWQFDIQTGGLAQG